MNWKSEKKPFFWIISIFLTIYFFPVGNKRVDNAIFEGFYLLKWYAREHILVCLIPAFFIAGAIAVFISKESVMKYLGVGAKKIVAYGVASVSGTILAVCSCTVLPLFTGIYEMGAGLGPATAFLYSGPAINVLAIILTARVLGFQLGIARAVGAITFSVIIGVIMHLLFRKEESKRSDVSMVVPEQRAKRSLWGDAVYFAAMVGILIFANWGKPDDPGSLWYWIYSNKWLITGIMEIMFAIILVLWMKIGWWKVMIVCGATLIFALLIPSEPLIPFAVAVVGLSIITALGRGEISEWFEQTWGFTKLILPLLFVGVFVAGILFGRPGDEGLIPSAWISRAVGGNSLGANLFASVSGAFMYFATLTEVPILQGLLGNGMGKGPALALLLAGPALSLPNMLVIRTIMGNKKTIAFISLVVVMATIAGMIFGAFVGN